MCLNPPGDASHLGCIKKLKTQTLRPALHQSQGQKNLGADFEHFWLANWSEVTNKCQNIDVRILLNAGTLIPRVANWSQVTNKWYTFFSIGAKQKAIEFSIYQYLGQIEKFFLNFSLDSQCKALGADFNFCTNRNAGFGLNIGPDSQSKADLIQTHQCAGESCAGPSAIELHLGVPTACELLCFKNSKTKQKDQIEHCSRETGDGNRPRIIASADS